MGISRFVSSIGAIILLFGLHSTTAAFHPINLNAEALYQGAKAIRVKVSQNPKGLTLDLRNHDQETTGFIETDVLPEQDLDSLTIPEKESIDSLSLLLTATIPQGARVRTWIQSGNRYFSDSTWSQWVEWINPKANKVLNGQYFRLKIQLEASSKGDAPTINAVLLTPMGKPKSNWIKPIRITSFSNEKIIRSQYPFEWERRDEPSLQNFLKKTPYPQAYQNGLTELDRFLRLNTAVARTDNHDHKGWTDEPYPISALSICSFRNDTLSIKGHCMSYAAVLMAALTGVGQYARHWSVEGFRQMDHEVVEVWSNDLKKWVYLDPSLSQYYLNPESKTINSILENHQVYTTTYFRPGENMGMLTDSTSPFPMSALKKRLTAMGGGTKAPILCVDSGWHYGAPPPKDYDWGWRHGYLAEGYMRMTTRNNYYSKPKPLFEGFGRGMNYGEFIQYIDETTPPFGPKVKTFSGRERDFWFSLNQASIKLKRISETTIQLELGQSQPFFRQYRIVMNGMAKTTAQPICNWELKTGHNTFSVTPEDEWGTFGLSSSIAIDY